MAYGEQNLSFAGTVMIQLINFIERAMKTTPKTLWLNYMTWKKNICFYKHVGKVEKGDHFDGLIEMAQQFCSGLVSSESDS